MLKYLAGSNGLKQDSKVCHDLQSWGMTIVMLILIYHMIENVYKLYLTVYLWTLDNKTISDRKLSIHMYDKHTIKGTTFNCVYLKYGNV